MSLIRHRQSLSVGLLLASVSFPLVCAHGQDQTSRKRNERALRVVVDRPWHKWLEEDVRYIITDQERADFQKLTTDDQRDKFVEAFWAHRNPTPGSVENTFKEEHYRRIAYANTHFAAGAPGWKTDRGQIYIVYGPPDHVEKKSKGSGLGQPTQYPSEMWRYKIMLDVGRDVSVEFIDSCQCGEYHLSDPDKFAHPGNQF